MDARPEAAPNPSEQDPEGRGPRLELELLEHARAFEQHFPAPASAGPVRLFFSPGRVNLMGAHLDYNGGSVMPMAIDRGTFVAVRERDDRRVRLASTKTSDELEFSVDAPPAERTERWVDYPMGVLHTLRGGTPDCAPTPALPALAAGLGARRSDPPARACGLDVLYGGNLPVGAGLSSSASICVGTAYALDAVWGLGLTPVDRVRMALWAEREFVGVRCGIMDPFAVGLSRAGQLLWLDCKDERVRHLPFRDEDVLVAIADTGVRRELAKGEFNARVEQCEQAFRALSPHAPEARVLCDVPLSVLDRHEAELEPVLAKRARHVLEEVARLELARSALERGELAGFGAQMSAAHESLRDLYEVSVPELDCLVEASLEVEGVLGTRLTGAGFGGCTVVLLRSSARDELAAHVGRVFHERFGRRPQIGFYGGDPGPREFQLTN